MQKIYVFNMIELPHLQAQGFDIKKRGLWVEGKVPVPHVE